jgi:hypothetical protein
MRGTLGDLRVRYARVAESLARADHPVAEVLLHWDAWFASGPGLSGRSVVVAEIARVLGVPSSATEAQKHEALRCAFRDRRLTATRLPRRKEASPHSALDDAALEGPVRPTIDETTHWIAIQLVEDDDVGRPIPHARYVLTLPDGRTLQGRLDAQGLARVDDIPAGVCRVRFPDYDDRSFEGAPQSPGAVLPPPPRPAAGPQGATGAAIRATPTSEGCELTKVTVGPTFKRRPNAQGVLQVVPTPTLKKTQNFDWKVGTGPDMLDKMSKGASAFEIFRGNGSRIEGLDRAWQRADEEKKTIREQKRKTGASPYSRSIKVATARWTGGVASVTVIAEATRPCPVAHSFAVSDGRRLPFPAPGISFAFEGPGTDSTVVEPTRYTVSARGCDGATPRMTVEVFPGDQRFVSFAVGAKRDVFESLLATTNETLKRSSMRQSELSFSGGFELVTGWREDKRSWRAYHATEFATKFDVKWETSFDVSFVSMITHIPSGFLEYVGDIGLRFTPTFAIGARGSIEARRFPWSPTEREHAETAGAVKLEGKGSIAVAAHAHLGPRSILGVEITGKVEPALKLTGTIAVEPERVTLNSSLTLARGDFEVTVLTQALIWRREYEWKFPLWDEKTLLQSDERVLYERSRDGEGAA